MEKITMTTMFLALLTIAAAPIYADIITFEKSGLPQASQPDSGGAKQDGTDNEEMHLPLSSLFSQSDRYKCMIQGKKHLCTQDDHKYMREKFGDSDETLDEGAQKESGPSQQPDTKVEQEHYNSDIHTNKHIKPVIGPRYQPIHLHLPRKAMYQVMRRKTRISVQVSSKSSRNDLRYAYNHRLICDSQSLGYRSYRSLWLWIRGLMVTEVGPEFESLRVPDHG